MFVFWLYIVHTRQRHQVASVRWDHTCPSQQKASHNDSHFSPVTYVQISTSPAAFLSLAGPKHTIPASLAAIAWRGTSRCGRVGSLGCSNLLLSWWLSRFPSLAAACEVRHDNQLNIARRTSLSKAIKSWCWIACSRLWLIFNFCAYLKRSN